MIPAGRPYDAVFKTTENGRDREWQKPVIAWDDNGNALVADHEEGALRAVSTAGNFVRLQEARGPAAGVIPGAGWRAVFGHGEDRGIHDVLAWVIDQDGYGAALWADEEGQVLEVTEIDDFARLLAPGDQDGPAVTSPEDPGQDHRRPLTEDEGETLLAGALTAAGQGGQSEDDLDRILRWAAQAKADAFLLGEVLAGRAGAFIDADGEVRVKTIGGENAGATP